MLFGQKEEDRNVLDTLLRRVELLRPVNGSHKYWRKVVKGGGEDNLCSECDIFNISRKAPLLMSAYNE